ncbi:transposase [Natrinema thermotolerans DSM 11552]|nr:transposase [Natrinema thermotolerans DSM 11552]
MGIRLHLSELSVSNTVRKLDKFGVKRSRKAVQDWIHKCDLQSATDASPNHVVLDETVIRIDNQQYWLYASVGPKSNELPHIRLFSTTTTALTELFLQELTEKHDVENAVFLVDGAKHLQAALRRSGLRFRYEKHGNRHASERVFRDIKRRTSSFSNCFSHAKPSTAEFWLQAFAVWHNATN